MEKIKWKTVYIPSGRNNTKKKQVCSFVFTYLLISLFCWYCQVVSSELTNLKETDKAKEITELEIHIFSCKENVFLLCLLWPVTFHYCPVIRHLIDKFLLQKCFHRSRAEHTCSKNLAEWFTPHISLFCIFHQKKNLRKYVREWMLSIK